MQREGVETGATLVATATDSPDLEVKDAQLIFGAVWRELEGLFGRSAMRFPRELILLGGAPGAGKGTNSDFIRKVRSIDAPPIVISQLLDTPLETGGHRASALQLPFTSRTPRHYLRPRW